MMYGHHRNIPGARDTERLARFTDSQSQPDASMAPDGDTEYDLRVTEMMQFGWSADSRLLFSYSCRQHGDDFRFGRVVFALIEDLLIVA